MKRMKNMVSSVYITVDVMHIDMNRDDQGK